MSNNKLGPIQINNKKAIALIRHRAIIECRSLSNAAATTIIEHLSDLDNNVSGTEKKQENFGKI
jgi:hypothetical protein